MKRVEEEPNLEEYVVHLRTDVTGHTLACFSTKKKKKCGVMPCRQCVKGLLAKRKVENGVSPCMVSWTLFLHNLSFLA